MKMHKPCCALVFVALLLLSACTIKVEIAEPVKVEVVQPTTPTGTPEPTPQSSLAPTGTPSASIITGNLLPTRAATPQATALPQPVNIAALGENVLLALGKNGTLSILTDDGWLPQTISVSSNCSDDSEVLFGLANDIVVRCSGVQRSVDGVNWESLNGLAVAKSADQKLWVVSPKFIKIFSPDGTSQEIPASKITGGKDLPFGRAMFDAKGTLWIMGTVLEKDAPLLLAFDGSTWRMATINNFKDSAGETPKYLILNNVVLNKAGGILALSGSGSIYKLDSKSPNFTFEEVLDSEKLSRLIVAETVKPNFTRAINDTDQNLWMATDYGLFKSDGKDIYLSDYRNKLLSLEVSDVAQDVAGNLWVATSFGVGMSDKKGNGEWQNVALATSGLGDSRIVAIAVRGAPALPKPTQPRTASINGRITENGTLVTNRRIQLCSGSVDRTLLDNAGTPCQNNFFTALAITDADGNYRFESIPIGAYNLVIERGQYWSVVYFGNELLLLQPNQDMIVDVKLS